MRDSPKELNDVRVDENGLACRWKTRLLHLHTLESSSSWPGPPEPPHLSRPRECSSGKRWRRLSRRTRPRWRSRWKFARRPSGRKFVLQVSIRPDAPSVAGLEAKPEVIERQAFRIEGRQARKEVRVNVPLPPAGTHEVTFLISGDSSEEGYSDKAIRYLIVDDRGEFRFITGQQKSKEESQRRKEKLKESLRKDPRRPDLRLLAEDLVPLTDDRINAIQPFKLPVQRQILAPPAGPGAELEGLYRQARGQTDDT